MHGLRSLVLRNLTMQGVSEAVALACGLAATAILSRHLGVAGFGAFNYVFAFMYLFLSLNDLGVNTIVVREISQTRERAAAIAGAAMSLRLVIALVVLIAAWAAIWLWPMDAALRPPLLLFALVLPINALNVPALLLQTFMRFDLSAAATVIWRVTGLVLTAAAVLAGFGLMAVLGALLLSDVIGTAAVHLFARRFGRLRPRIDVALWRMLLRGAMPVAVTLLLIAVVNRVDFIMLERMTSLDQVGLYGAAYRVTNMLEKFPILVMGTLYPIMSLLAATDARRLREVYRRSVWRFAVLGVPLALGVALIAPWLLATVFGEPYRAAAPALRYLVWATACLYPAMTGGNLLNSVRRSRDNVLALTAGAAANIGLNALLIPSRGIEGAAMATAASYALVLVLTLVAVQRHFTRAGVRADA